MELVNHMRVLLCAKALNNITSILTGETDATSALLRAVTRTQ